MLLPLAALVLLCLVGVGAWLALSSHRGTATPAGAPQPTSHQSALIHLCGSCAAAYNPDAPDGDFSQNNSQAGLAIDGDLGTSWNTQQYYDNNLNKPGVGLYVKANPALSASRLVLDTTTPGFSATIYGSQTAPAANQFSSSWIPLDTVSSVTKQQPFTLRQTGTRYAYYLVWVTTLPSGSDSVSLNEVLLYS